MYLLFTLPFSQITFINKLFFYIVLNPSAFWNLLAVLQEYIYKQLLKTAQFIIYFALRFLFLVRVTLSSILKQLATKYKLWQLWTSRNRNTDPVRVNHRCDSTKSHSRLLHLHSSSYFALNSISFAILSVMLNMWYGVEHGLSQNRVPQLAFLLKTTWRSGSEVDTGR